MPHHLRTLLHSRLLAAVASLAVALSALVAGAAVSSASASEAPALTILSPSALDGLAQAEGIGVDPVLGLAVLSQSGGGDLWTVDTKALELKAHVKTPFSTQNLNAHGTLDPVQHVVYFGQVLTNTCTANPVCNTTLVPGAAAVAAAPRPKIQSVELTSTGTLPATEYTLPVSAAGMSIVAMRPATIAGRHLLYVLVNQVHDAINAGFAHLSTLYELDADLVRAGAAAGTADAVLWAHDVSGCANFAAAPSSFLGVDPAGRFAYFACRNIVVNSANFTPGGAVVVDFPQPLPTADQEQAGQFTNSFFPAGAPTAGEQSSGDPVHNLLIQAVVDGQHNKLFVFDAVHRAWTGSVPVGDIGSNLWGVAVDSTNGEAYTVGDVNKIAVSQGTALPVRLGGTISLGDLNAQGGSGPPLFDPVNGQLFMFGNTWADHDRKKIPGVAIVVYTDKHRFAPFDETPPDPDQFTHDVPITPDTPLSYQAIASGYGLRAVQVGGLSGTQASNEHAVDVSNPAYSIDTDCAFAKVPCAGIVPSFPDGSRAITFARADVSTQSSGVTGNATPLQLDSTTEAESTSLTTPATFLHGFSNLTGQQPPGTPDPPPPPDQVSQQVAPASCSDYSDKAEDIAQPSGRAQCDNVGRRAAAVAVAPGPGSGSPVQVAYAMSRIERASQSATGTNVDVTSEAHGVVVGVPGGPTLRIGSVITHASTVAVGQAKSAVGTFSRTISDVTISDAAGSEVFACGFHSSPSCDPQQLTDEFNKRSSFPVEFLTPDPDGYYGRESRGLGAQKLPGSPGGAQAEVIKSVYDYFNDMNINGDASFEVPGLQIVMVNDGQQPSRLVFNLAAVHAESHQSLGLPPPPPPEKAPPSLQLTLLDDATPPAPLSGGTFSVKGPSGSPVTCLTAADGIGTCTFPKLVPGSYKISETAAPPGFAAVDDYTVSLEAGTQYKTSFVNLPAIGSVKLSLAAPGDDAVPLSGGVFAMHKGSDLLAAPVATCTTDGKGACGFDKVPLGDYTMEQVTAPDGYLVSKPAAFKLTKPRQVATLHFVDGVPAKPAVPPTVIVGTPPVPPRVIPGRRAVPPRVIPGKPAVPPRTMVLPALDGGAQPAFEPAAYETSSGPAPVVASQPSGSMAPLDLGGGSIGAVSARLARLVMHSPQQAVLLLFVWLVLGLPVYLWVRRRQFITATEGI
jgi:hypothetical protein